MKKLAIIFILGLVVPNLNAQSIFDAYQYSKQDILGTARYRGMSGAFGALGGDLSALHRNPAGGAIFERGAAAFTLSTYTLDNETGYFNEFTTTSIRDVEFNQGGGLIVFNNGNSNSPWKKIALAFNYDRTSNFDDEFVASGISNTSVDQYFLINAQGVPLDLLQLQDNESIDDLYQFLGENEGFSAQQAFLGYQAFVIEPNDNNDPNNTAYFSNVASGNFDQRYLYSSFGYNGQGNFNLSTQYGEQLYLGVNLNTHFFDLSRTTILEEQNSNSGSLINSIQFENNLRSLGSGFSFQLGGILEVNPQLRLGATYNSPTWFEISEETTQGIRTERSVDDQVLTELIRPNVINIYENYRLKTPDSYTGSASYIFGPQGLISFDYTFTNYDSMEFRPTGDAFFQQQNNAIGSTFKGAATYRIGGEYRVEQWSLRGGYRFEESPTEDENLIGSLQGFSLGLGYSFGNTRLDFAYDRSQRERAQFLYETGLTTTAQVEQSLSNFVATLSFKL
ncbi:OmpP1/FadL family transporter [Croceiramulus getboli]|nr:outer membrane protein transport protein [Flavobacteriaceae bacterium YJPT1-3]